MLGLQPVQGRQPRRAAQLVIRPLGKRRVVPGMPPPGDIQLTGLRQALERKLADRLQHAHPRLTIKIIRNRDQADVEQFGDLLQ